MGLLSKKIAIDLGASRTRIYVPRKGIVVDEPSIIAFDKSKGKLVGVGFEAEDVIGKEPENLIAIRPLAGGVIGDFKASVSMLREFIVKAAGSFHLQRPEAIITVTDAATSTEQKAVIDAGESAGLQNVSLINSSLAAALGAGQPVQEPRANMTIDIGSSTTDIGVFSLGGTVVTQSVRVGGDALNEMIVRYLRQYYGIKIGRLVAEEIKKLLLSLIVDDGMNELSVNGISLQDNLPKSVNLNAQELRPFIDAGFERIILTLRSVIEKTPPDLVADISEYGIKMTGGGAMLKGLPEYLTTRIRAEFRLAQDPLLCGAKGANIALTHLGDYKRHLQGF